MEWNLVTKCSCELNHIKWWWFELEQINLLAEYFGNFLKDNSTLLTWNIVIHAFVVLKQLPIPFGNFLILFGCKTNGQPKLLFMFIFVCAAGRTIGDYYSSFFLVFVPKGSFLFRKKRVTLNMVCSVQCKMVKEYLFSFYKGTWRQQFNNNNILGGIESKKKTAPYAFIHMLHIFEWFFFFRLCHDVDRVLISWDWNLNPLKGCLLY